MHVFNVATLFIVIALVGVEFSVSAFVNPAAWRLDPEPQLAMLGRFAFVLGRVMPIWYPVCTVLLAVQTWLNWQTPGRDLLLIATALWVLTSVASLLVLVPLNTRIAQGAPDWQPLHHTWDSRHRVRIAALAIAALLLTAVLVR
jgi:uncharacterized membrane protein